MFSLLVLFLIVAIIFGVLYFLGKIAWTILKWLVIALIIALIISWLL
jgi:hypothetical protein